MRFLAAALLTAFVFAAPAFAGELKVLDEDGMTRAVKIVSAPAAVEVSTSDPAQTLHFVLSQVNGLSPDIEGSAAGDKIVFSAVPEGTWQLKCVGCQTQITVVAIR